MQNREFECNMQRIILAMRLKWLFLMRMIIICVWFICSFQQILITFSILLIFHEIEHFQGKYDEMLVIIIISCEINVVSTTINS